jgi:hypothetical protein
MHLTEESQTTLAELNGEDIAFDSPGVGRPSKFTAECRKVIVEAIGRGLPYCYAATKAGISYPSFCNYRRDHPDFADEILRAEADAIDSRLAIIEKASATDPSCAKWWLEHRFPQHFAKTRIEISGPDGSPIAAGVVAILLPPKGSVPTPLAATVTEIEDVP